MAKYLNTSGVPLSLAVFLATDHYDHNDDPNTISATSLIKPVRQLVLAARVPDSMGIELEGMLASRMGTAIHDGIERAWQTNYQRALRDLGYPEKVIDRIIINPHPDQLKGAEDWAIPIYMEQRLSRKVGKWTVTGKFDFIGEGRLEDFKTTSVYAWMMGNNDDKYILQGSIYRWLDPKIITRNEMAIQFIFTDWARAKAMQDPKYPPKRTMERTFPLLSEQQIDLFVRNKLEQIEQYWEADEALIPECSDADLWRSEPEFKYYKNPTKTSRSTKNFATKQEAYMRLAEDGNVGVVIERPGQATACKFCAAFPVCSQKDRLIASGDLTL